jgi:predicted component of type VI protein secretion system
MQTIQKDARLLDEVQTEIKKGKMVRKELKQAKEKLVAAEQVLKELDANEQHAQRTLKVIQEKAERQAKSFESKLMAAAVNVEQTQKQKQDAQMQLENTAKMVEQNAQMSLQMQSSIEAANHAHEREMSELNDQLAGLETVFEQYHQSLMGSIATV